MNADNVIDARELFAMSRAAAALLREGDSEEAIQARVDAAIDLLFKQREQS
jgi:hypothetical protein